MLSYALKRLTSLVPVLLIMATIAWVMMILVPGDPAQLLAGRGADPRVVEAIRHHYDLDESRPTQYVDRSLRTLVLRGPDVSHRETIRKRVLRVQRASFVTRMRSAMAMIHGPQALRWRQGAPF